MPVAVQLISWNNWAEIKRTEFFEGFAQVATKEKKEIFVNFVLSSNMPDQKSTSRASFFRKMGKSKSFRRYKSNLIPLKQNVLNILLFWQICQNLLALLHF